MSAHMPWTRHPRATAVCRPRLPVVLAALCCLCIGSQAQAEVGGCRDRKGALDHRLAIRDRLDLSGDADKPATLSLQHTAGESSFGTADIALIGDLACISGASREAGNELRLAYGFDYHFNGQDDARSEQASVGASLGYGWGADIEPSQSRGGDLGNWQRIAATASVGRDIENGRNLASASLFYDTTPLGSTKAARVVGDTIRIVGPLGGTIRKYLGETKRSAPLIRYQLRPGLEYFRGYQPDETVEERNAAYAALAGDIAWKPNAADADAPQLYMQLSAIGRSRIEGDPKLPSNAHSLSAAFGMELTRNHGKHGGVYRTSSIELSYEVGRRPENGFVREERLMLRFTYLWDRVNTRL